MENLDKYLKKIEENVNYKPTEYEIKIPSLDDTMKIRTLTIAEKRDWQSSVPVTGIKTVGDVTQNPTMRKIIYNVMGLKEIAVAAKEKGLINSYYDVIDYLFTVEDLVDIVQSITEHNTGTDSGIDDLKN